MSKGSKVSQMLERATMFYYSGTDASLDENYTEHLQSIEAVVGSHILQVLEGLLQPKALAKTSQDQLISLFLLLFGELIAVGAKMTTRNVRPHAMVETEISHTNLYSKPRSHRKVLGCFMKHGRSCFVYSSITW